VANLDELVQINGVTAVGELTGFRAAVSSVTRHRLEVQGFTCLSDASLREVGPWLRLTPGLCTTIVMIGTALALPALLWLLVPVALFGAVFPRHPFDLFYNLALRRFTGTSVLPPNGAPRRFACGMAAVWIGATAGAFTAGYSPLGYALGGVLSAVGLLVSTTHFCIPSLIYRFVTRTQIREAPQAGYLTRG
jgi:hypothetical protein